MTKHVRSRNGDACRCSSVAPLKSILYTEQLRRRPSRMPNHEKESRALVALAHALADSPLTIFQTLADTILEVSQADSAGLSLLSEHDGGKRFYWPAIAGRWKRHTGGGTPRDFAPSGDVLDHNRPLLFRRPERRYTYFQPTPRAEECLLVPFYVEEKAVGTIWAVAHDERREFDSEDARLLTSLGEFASSAYRVLASLNALKSEVAERKQAERALRQGEEGLRALAQGLEAQVRVRTQELEQRHTEILRQSSELRELSNRLLQSQDDERRRIARELHDSAGQIVTVLSMNLGRMGPHAKKNPELDKAIQDSQELVQQLSKEVRTLAYLLHPPLLDEGGLSGAVRCYLQGMMERSNLRVGLNISEDFGRLSGEMEMTLFRILQECLTNIHRHSGSKTAAIRLIRGAGSVSLEIQDQGKGMPDGKLAGSPRHVGVGITGMRERVRCLKGVMDIQSSGGGTKISVTLPVAPATISEPRKRVAKD